MNKLEERFNKEIENRKFNFLEITGFKSKPKLALMAGMAIGYKMAICDIASQSLNTADGKACPLYVDYRKSCKALKERKAELAAAD